MCTTFPCLRVPFTVWDCIGSRYPGCQVSLWIFIPILHISVGLAFPNSSSVCVKLEPSGWLLWKQGCHDNWVSQETYVAMETASLGSELVTSDEKQVQQFNLLLACRLSQHNNIHSAESCSVVTMAQYRKGTLVAGLHLLPINYYSRGNVLTLSAMIGNPDPKERSNVPYIEVKW